MSDDNEHNRNLDAQTGTNQAVETQAVSSNYKVLGHNKNNGTTYGVLGQVDSADGYGLYTPDDAKIEGVLDTAGTDFVVEAGTTSTNDARNVLQGHASNQITDGAVGAVIAGGGSDDGTTALPNIVTDDYATVSGGRDNQAGRDTDDDPSASTFATVGGGHTNIAYAARSVISGGADNDTTSPNSTIGGGRYNTIRSQADGAVVAGGDSNSIDTDCTASTIGGGSTNDIRNGASFATIAGGGPSNTGDTSTRNYVYDDYGTIGGGGNNQAGSSDSDETNATYSTVGGGKHNEATAANSTIGGGLDNSATSHYSTVSGGSANDATASYATAGGGTSNLATGSYATIAGGQENEATDSWTSVTGGRQNKVNATYAGIMSGDGNQVNSNGYGSVICGGYSNINDGGGGMIVGGHGNKVTGDDAFASGAFAEAADNHSFVWNDGSGASDSTGDSSDRFSSSTTDGTSGVTGVETFHVKSKGGVRFVTDGANDKVTYISSGNAGWSNTSTRTAKTNLEPVDPESALAGVDSLAMSSWEYKDDDGEGNGTRFIGPMAEEFHDAFDVGDSDSAINSINADGVAFAAIQALSSKLDDARVDIQEKRERIEHLEAEKEATEDRVDELEGRLAGVEEHLEAIESGASSTAIADD
jgi:hypothetical protein